MHAIPTKPACATRLVAALIAIVLSGTCWARDKTDVIFMTNGDRLTGEIKQLEHGKLLLSTEAMGQVLIEWDDIRTGIVGRLESLDAIDSTTHRARVAFAVETAGGAHHVAVGLHIHLRPEVRKRVEVI